MEKIVKALFICFIAAASLLFVADMASAQTNERVYKAYSVKKEQSKFPMKLSNSLVVDITSNEKPIIFKNGTVVWQGTNGWSNAVISFTVTKNGDTYLYYKTDKNGTESVEVVGLSSEGKKLLNKTFTGDGAGIHTQFVSPSIIEIGIEEFSVFYDGSAASKHSDSYQAKFYQLYINGSAKEVNYFDNAFAALAKKGQMKWVPGALGMSYSNLKKAVGDPAAYPFMAEHFNFYRSVFGLYGFYYNSNGTSTIKPHAKVRAIFRESKLHGSRKALRPYFRQHFGKEVLSNGRDLDVYRTGKYYLSIQYFDANTVHLNYSTDNIFGF
ncbi:hypothetical protein CSV75_08605 [Sporosarcina sp. P18a]|uniref:hypothetical protein n=1 Tax=Sporosarcina sp. P18a TaxID=2048259 RepID=UPI000C16D1D7|nr:hypothetical protein [Sporosarcina sp. P18a]PIC80021.1 hypothetical protein CSV75_08605 [Sporosarcina sp. P18a]